MMGHRQVEQDALFYECFRSPREEPIIFSMSALAARSSIASGSPASCLLPCMGKLALPETRRLRHDVRIGSLAEVNCSAVHVRSTPGSGCQMRQPERQLWGYRNSRGANSQGGVRWQSILSAILAAAKS